MSDVALPASIAALVRVFTEGLMLGGGGGVSSVLMMTASGPLHTGLCK